VQDKEEVGIARGVIIEEGEEEEEGELNGGYGLLLYVDLALLVVVSQINSVLLLSLVDGEQVNTTLGNALLSKQVSS
jgi:hypothetical protein